MQSLSKIELGGCSVSVVSGGALKLDGGAMFGIIPKALWSKVCPADEQNRIQLACNCLLVEFAGDSGRRVIIETGHGEKYSAKESAIYAIEPAQWLLPALRARGVEPESISDVVLSHLHFDHAGGLTRFQGSDAVATFPKAQVHVQRREFEDARANFGIMTMTYREENYQAIDALDAWRLIDGEATLVESSGVHIRSLLTPGHTRGHHSLLIEGRDRAVLFTGDVMPTRHHAGAPYNMGYDLFPLDNRDSKARMLGLAAERSWLIAIDHDPEALLVAVARDGKGVRLDALPA